MGRTFQQGSQGRWLLDEVVDDSLLELLDRRLFPEMAGAVVLPVCAPLADVGQHLSEPVGVSGLLGERQHCRVDRREVV